MIVHNKLCNLGAAGSIILGGVGIYETYKYAERNRSIGYHNLIQYGAYSLVGGAFFGFGIGYYSPILVPYLIYENIQNKSQKNNYLKSK